MLSSSLTKRKNSRGGKKSGWTVKTFIFNFKFKKKKKKKKKINETNNKIKWNEIKCYGMATKWNELNWNEVKWNAAEQI